MASTWAKAWFAPHSSLLSGWVGVYGVVVVLMYRRHVRNNCHIWQLPRYLAWTDKPIYSMRLGLL